MAQAPFIATDEQRARVRELSGLGLPQKRIAKLVGCSVPTLDTHFRDELDQGMAEADAAVAGNLYRLATSTGTREAITAAIFWAKTRMGWKETHVVEVSELPKIVIARDPA